MADSNLKVAVIGAGRTGASIARRLAAEGLGSQIVLVDDDHALAWAEAADLNCARGLSVRRTRVFAGNYYDCADAALCILTGEIPAGLPELERLNEGAKLLGRLVPSVMSSGFDGVLLTAVRPSGPMTWLAQQLSELPERQVFGVGTTADTARLRCHLAELFGEDDVDAFLLGEQDQETMIPWSCVAVAGKPLEDFLDEAPERRARFDPAAVDNIVAETAHNIALAKGGDYCTIAAVAAEMTRAVLGGGPRLLPVSAMLHGEYGVEGVYASVPAELDLGGVRAIREYPLNEGELAQFHRAVQAVRAYMSSIY